MHCLLQAGQNDNGSLGQIEIRNNRIIRRLMYLWPQPKAIKTTSFVRQDTSGPTTAHLPNRWWGKKLLPYSKCCPVETLQDVTVCRWLYCTSVCKPHKSSQISGSAKAYITDVVEKWLQNSPWLPAATSTRLIRFLTGGWKSRNSYRWRMKPVNLNPWKVSTVSKPDNQRRWIKGSIYRRTIISWRLKPDNSSEIISFSPADI